MLLAGSWRSAAKLISLFVAGHFEWDPSPEADLAGYEIVYVAKGITKDSYLFAVRMGTAAR